MDAIVSNILNSRKREPDGLKKTAAISLAVHVCAVAGLMALPAVLPAPAQQPRVVMSISLGGSPGPRTGGMQMIGGRAIQAAAPSAVPQISKTVPPTPATPPKMALPDPKQKPRATAKPTATSKDPLGTGRGRGFETQEGVAKIDTGVKGQGFGLSSAGGGGGGSTLDTKDFCCPEYIADMLTRVRNNWNQQQRASGLVIVKYTIQRNGQLSDIEVERPSGNPLLDMASQRALFNTRTIAPLPAGYADQTLTVHLEFRYER